MRPITDFLRNVKYGLQNLWKWKRIIYVDRDWDWAFLYTIMKHKIEFMASLHEKYGICQDKHLLIADMKQAAYLLSKLADDNYGENLTAEEYYTQLNNDKKKLFKLLEEKSMEWWD